MVMQNFDPAVAASVWQRVQAANEGRCTEKPACPFEGIPTIPAMPVVAKKTRPSKKMQRNDNCGGFPLWLIIFLLCM